MLDISTPTAVPGAVVVAVDDSSQSRVTMAWAADYARQNNLALNAVHVLRYDFGAPESWSPGLRGVVHTVSAPVVDIARVAVRELVDAEDPDGTWTLTFLTGSTGPEIVRFAGKAALLVVGTREHRGIERLLIGSVSRYCLGHAGCPVVAVPPVLVTPSAGTAEAGRYQRTLA